MSHTGNTLISVTATRSVIPTAIATTPIATLPHRYCCCYCQYHCHCDCHYYCHCTCFWTVLARQHNISITITSSSLHPTCALAWIAAVLRLCRHLDPSPATRVWGGSGGSGSGSGYYHVFSLHRSTYLETKVCSSIPVCWLVVDKKFFVLSSTQLLWMEAGVIPAYLSPITWCARLSLLITLHLSLCVSLCLKTVVRNSNHTSCCAHLPLVLLHSGIAGLFLMVVLHHH